MVFADDETHLRDFEDAVAVCELVSSNASNLRRDLLDDTIGSAKSTSAKRMRYYQCLPLTGEFFQVNTTDHTDYTDQKIAAQKLLQNYMKTFTRTFVSLVIIM